MKVLNRKDFLAMPEGTFYCKGKPWYFDGFYIKGRSLYNPNNLDDWGDWIYLNPCWAEGKDSGECFDTLERSLQTGESFNCDKASGRDGCFDLEEIFLVFEKKDLLFLQTLIKQGLDI